MLAGLALGLSGCATKYAVRVDALSAEDGQFTGGRSYVRASATPGVGENDLFFKEVARHIEPVLIESGYIPAAAGQQAELRIAVDAHLSEPMVETRTYSDPVYVQTHGYSGMIRVPVVNSDGKVVRYHYHRYYDPPRMEMAGWVNRDQQVTVYDKVLRLSARRIGANGSLSDEAWTVRVAMRSASTDYRWALPYLMVAARPYIGQRTDGEEVILLTEDAEEVQAFRGQVQHGG